MNFSTHPKALRTHLGHKYSTYKKIGKHNTFYIKTFGMTHKYVHMCQSHGHGGNFFSTSENVFKSAQSGLFLDSRGYLNS